MQISKHVLCPQGTSDLRKQAIEIYKAIGMANSAAECFYTLKEYENAATSALPKIGELISMEEDFGKFLEAAKIVRMKGDILSEVDLLGKSG
ncbi:Mediator of RNA polymerase II transcription subunit 21 [Psidium guajava]|nr:Mediator of RNA polymerase II transcription subunit 21 [Psidium guajava]